MMTLVVKRAALALAIWLGIAQLAVAAPANVLITVGAGQAAPATYKAQLAAWRESGQVANVILLERRQVTGGGFDSLALLEFSSERSYQSWHDETANKLDPSVVAVRADVLLHGEVTPRDSANSTFQVNYYVPSVAPDRYRDFVERYIKPNMVNQKAKRVLMRYTMFLERGETGKAKSVLVLEYRDEHAYAESSPIVETEKARLRTTDPLWKQLDATKGDIRKAGPETTARYVELPAPALTDLPAYIVEYPVVGRLRIVGSELKNAVARLAEGFQQFHPDAKLTTNFMTSSEGAIAGLYFSLSDIAPMGDDAKITDQMPFFNTFGYMPTEISVATGGYEKRGALWAFAVVVNKDNPLEEISVDELERVFGSERTGGWELVDNDYRFTAKYARGPESNIRRWGQLGLKGAYANKEIETFGYSAPGFAIYFERNWFHWSKKWNGNFKEYVEQKQTTSDADGAAVASERPLEQLANNRYAIGLAALMHVQDAPGLKVLKVSAHRGQPAVALTPESVANRRYPLIRDAFFYVNRAPGKPLDPAVREFMRFVLSREGQQIIAKTAYYYPLKPDYLREQLKKLD